MLGVAVLVVDVARGNNLHLDLQNGADGLALAAAAELDGGSDAIVRANRAIANLVGNQVRFGDGGAFIIDQVTIADTPGEFRIFYLDEIPASDNDPIDAAWVTAHNASGAPTTARFAAVYAEPTDYSLLFPLDFFNQTTVPVVASAVAGFRAIVCDFSPMYICNPYGSYEALENAVLNLGTRRRLFQLRQAPGNPTNAAPGQFGFLISPLGNGTDEIRDMLARDDPRACFEQRGVELKHGQLGAAAANALNVRFDVYRAGMNSKKNEAHYQPSTNVRKGFNPDGGGSCPNVNQNPPSPPGLGKMPRDTCFTTGTCPLLGGYGGDGYWKCLTYWNNNHPPSSPPPPNCTDAQTSTLPSRYSVYMYEIENNYINDRAPNNETGVPSCYGSPGMTNTPPRADRRTIVGAILDCPVTSEPAPVVAYASFFLSEPADHGANTQFWGELVDITGRWGSGTLDGFERDDVQLYR